MERRLDAGILKLERAEYEHAVSSDNHIFLVGNLQRPTSYPFVRDERVEMIVCCYRSGEDGRYHWHRDITEYEWVVEGEVGYFEVATGLTHWFQAGDFVAVPPKACVQRRVRAPARTIAVKVPSSAEKTHCAQCDRVCAYRVDPYLG
jgi:uncharacterized cupin superfamily protein